MIALFASFTRCEEESSPRTIRGGCGSLRAEVDARGGTRGVVVGVGPRVGDLLGEDRIPFGVAERGVLSAHPDTLVEVGAPEDANLQLHAATPPAPAQVLRRDVDAGGIAGEPVATDLRAVGIEDAVEDVDLAAVAGEEEGVLQGDAAAGHELTLDTDLSLVDEAVAVVVVLVAELRRAGVNVGIVIVAVLAFGETVTVRVHHAHAALVGLTVAVVVHVVADFDGRLDDGRVAHAGVDAGAGEDALTKARAHADRAGLPDGETLVHGAVAVVVGVVAPLRRAEMNQGVMIVAVHAFGETVTVRVHGSGRLAGAVVAHLTDRAVPVVQALHAHLVHHGIAVGVPAVADLTDNAETVMVLVAADRARAGLPRGRRDRGAAGKAVVRSVERQTPAELLVVHLNEPALTIRAAIAVRVAGDTAGRVVTRAGAAGRVDGVEALVPPHLGVVAHADGRARDVEAPTVGAHLVVRAVGVVLAGVGIADLLAGAGHALLAGGAVAVHAALRGEAGVRIGGDVAAAPAVAADDLAAETALTAGEALVGLEVAPEAATAADDLATAATLAAAATRAAVVGVGDDTETFRTALAALGAARVVPIGLAGGVAAVLAGRTIGTVGTVQTGLTVGAGGAGGTGGTGRARRARPAVGAVGTGRTDGAGGSGFTLGAVLSVGAVLGGVDVPAGHRNGRGEEEGEDLAVHLVLRWW